MEARVGHGKPSVWWVALAFAQLSNRFRQFSQIWGHVLFPISLHVYLFKTFAIFFFDRVFYWVFAFARVCYINPVVVLALFSTSSIHNCDATLTSHDARLHQFDWIGHPPPTSARGSIVSKRMTSCATTTFYVRKGRASKM